MIKLTEEQMKEIRVPQNYWVNYDNKELDEEIEYLNEVIERLNKEIETLEQENSFLKQCIKIYMGD